MAVEKVTIMILILKVDLQCPCCYKKVKKILCKFPQIRDQAYDEKANKVLIKVVCCDPEKIRDKLCCKGCKVIKSIEIVEPPKPPASPPKPPASPPKPPASPPKPPASPPKPPASPQKPVEVVCHPPRRCSCGACCQGCGGGPCNCHGCGVPPACNCRWCGGYCVCGYGHMRVCHVSRCDYYFTEEYPQACSIM